MNLPTHDLAFIWSVEHNDAVNMQLVLRAYGLQYDLEYAQSVIDAQ